MEDLTVITSRKLYNNRDKFKWSEQHDEVWYKLVEKDYCYDVTQGIPPDQPSDRHTDYAWLKELTLSPCGSYIQPDGKTLRWQ